MKTLREISAQEREHHLQDVVGYVLGAMKMKTITAKPQTVPAWLMTGTKHGK
jgi:hypothetical protein